jgi:hypothetical protein
VALIEKPASCRKLYMHPAAWMQIGAVRAFILAYRQAQANWVAALRCHLEGNACPLSNITIDIPGYGALCKPLVVYNYV